MTLVLLSLSLSACGFHLRGGTGNVTDIGTVYIDADSTVPISNRLKAELIGRNVSIAETLKGASIVVALSNEKESKRIVSVGSTGRVSEYELRHVVEMKVAQSHDGNPPVFDIAHKANRVTVIREYTYDRRGVLGKADEALILRGEMREELVNHLVLRMMASIKSGVK